MEYLKEDTKWTKRRSLFYRPEYIGDADIWQHVRKGNELNNIASEVEINEEADKLRKLKKKAEAKSKYR